MRLEGGDAALAQDEAARRTAATKVRSGADFEQPVGEGDGQQTKTDGRRHINGWRASIVAAQVAPAAVHAAARARAHARGRHFVRGIAIAGLLVVVAGTDAMQRWQLGALHRHRLTRRAADDKEGSAGDGRLQRDCAVRQRGRLRRTVSGYGPGFAARGRRRQAQPGRPRTQDGCSLVALHPLRAAVGVANEQQG